MFTHLFKLIWNKKKQNFLLLCEMLISFMVMFAVFTMMVNYYRNYKQPMGFSYDRVWAVNFFNSHKFASADSSDIFYTGLAGMLRSMRGIESVSYAGSNVPFANSTSSTGFTQNGKKYRANFYMVGDDYENVFDIVPLEGRWFTPADRASADRPVVINRTMREEIFGNGKAIGQFVGDDTEKQSKKLRVIGVVPDIKDKGDFQPAGNALYHRIDTSDMRFIGTMVIKVSSSADAAFEGRVYKALTGAMKEATVEIAHLTRNREAMNKQTLVPVIIMLIIAGFLIINVALGLFGVLWYNINKRRGEIGLRRAVGATGNAVAGQIVVESLFLATLSLIIGVFFAAQFPLLNVFDLAANVYVTAIFLAVIFIYLLVLACSLYPGKQAAAVFPAVALHEE